MILFFFFFFQSLIKQSSLDEQNLEFDSSMKLIRNDDGMDTSERDVDEGVFLKQSGPEQEYYDNPNDLPQTRPDTPPPAKSKGLPWAPKVRQKDVDAFLDVSRLKFVGYKLQGDRVSLAGLPQPIHEGLSTLKKVKIVNFYICQYKNF